MTTRRLRLKSFALAGVVVAVLWIAHYGCTPGFTKPVHDGTLTSRRLGFEDRSLHYMEGGVRGQPLVVFVHGTPGSWTAFRHLLTAPRLTEATHMVAVDRIGFGQSQGSGPEPSFARQAAAISQVFDLNNSPFRVILVGHSLGGSIGLRVAIDHADAVGGLLVISSAVDPELGKPRWYNKLAHFRLVNWLLPGDLRAANVEMMPLADELSKVANRLPELKLPITVVQGGKDKLVHPASADFLASRVTSPSPRILRFPDAGHFLIWNDPQMIVDEIIRLIELERSRIPLVQSASTLESKQ